MNWVETVFGLAPDGGDGAFELAMTLAILTACVFVRWRVRRRSTR